ncbi:MAG: MG2 domain-containing protein, partial [Spirochaetales bacterium]|nr:MG2 domain-containing protein [Spirochaetales bacterium]
GCSKNKQLTYSSENDSLVEEISPTFIPRNAEIRITFTKETECKPQDALSFSPSQKGTWTVLDDKRTFVFTPDKPYKQNSEFSLIADCAKLFKGTESGKFTHPFVADKGWYKVSFEEMELNPDTNEFSLSALLETDIPVTLKKAKKTIRTEYSGSKVSTKWDNDVEKSDLFYFSVEGIKASDKNRNLKINWNGKSIGFSKKMDAELCGSKTFRIPAGDILDVIDINTSKKNSILISFSKILDKTQNLAGYVKAFGESGQKIPITNASIRGNILTVFSDNNFEEIDSVEISEGIRSEDGFHLGNTSNISLSGNWEIPEVQFANKGVILPTTQGTQVIVKTKNLTGLLVQVYAVPERTMYHFLQDSEIDSKKNLYRVGEPVYEKRVSLNWDDSMQNKYVYHGIDISDLTKKNSYGMYQVRISFRKRDIKYICRNGHRDFSNLPSVEDKIADDTKGRENSFWDFTNDLPWEERSTYWNYNNDPCHPAFYMENYHSEITARQNIIVSDLALSAKKDNSGKLYVTASNLKDTQPVKNATISLYNYIGKKLAEEKTDGNGTVIFEYSENIEYLTGTAGNQTTYLKLSAGTELSISHFETGGEMSKEGVKGFIYGERGVWRPGDTMYLTFIMQDANKSLPPDIPVNFELVDPLGNTVEKRLLTDHVDGFYPFETATSAGGTTGLYTAKVSIGGNTWTKGLRVESIVPNKLSVKLTSSEKLLSRGMNSLKLEGAWLHGASAAGYKADVAVSYSPAKPGFNVSEEFSFANPLNRLSERREQIFEGKLNASSYCDINAYLESDSKAPGFMDANFVSRIYEPSGAFSTEYSTMRFSPYSRYVGLRIPKGDASRNMLLTDTKHTADVLCYEADGTPVSNALLQWNLYKIEWKWWWEKDAYSNAGYVEDIHYNSIAAGTIDISNGKGSFEFEVKYPSWGRYLIVVSDGRNGHSAGKITYIDWPNWAGRSTESGSGSSSMVALSTDKKSYVPGETASVSFASSKGARALVTIEKNGFIQKQEWIETASETTIYKVKVTPEMAPNIYVHVTLVQPHLQTANSLPIRLYGIVPVAVENPESVLEPVITCADQFEPAKETVISVSEKNGKPMTYTLAVVDEGLLGLTSFRAPNPHDEFYKKEASQLKSWDIYSYVINAYTGNLETLLAVGGGDDINAGNNGKTNRFAPVVKYFGPFELKAGEKKSTSFKMPHYIGAVRAFVIAGKNGAYGVSEKTTVVKSDLMVQSSLPKTLGTNESIDVPVTVFNGTGKKETVTVEFTAKGAVEKTEKKEITIDANSDGIVYFTIDTEAAGTAEFTFKAKGRGNKSALQSYDISINSRGSNFTYTKDFGVKSNSAESVSVESPFEEGTASLSLAMSNVPSFNLEKRLNYLITYPHGCIEQITSGAFPQIYLPDFLDLSKDKVSEIQYNVTSTFKRYSNYQLAKGAFAYWPGSLYANEWGTCYALHFMTEAKRKGWSVPENIYNPALDYIYEKSVNWTNTEKESKELEAYRLYILALAGKADLGTMNRIFDSTDLNDSSLALLSSAYSLTGNKQRAEKLLKKIVSFVPFFRTTGEIFASSIRDDSLRLLAAVHLENQMLTSKYSKKVTENLASKEWMSTQETAWSLLSLFALYGNNESQEKSYTVINGQGESKASFSKTYDFMEIEASKGETQAIKVKNTGSKMLYGTLTSTGKLKPGSETECSNGISLDVKYTNDNGSSVRPKGIKHGDNFVMTVSLKNKTSEKIENIALTIPIPTGWEFSNDRIGSKETSDSKYSYMDIKDDRILVYFDLEPNRGRTTFSFNVTSAYSGAYWIPAVSAEAMYDNSKSALTSSFYADTRKEK